MQEIQTRNVNLVAIGEEVLYKITKLMKSLSIWNREEDQGSVQSLSALGE